MVIPHLGLQHGNLSTFITKALNSESSRALGLSSAIEKTGLFNIFPPESSLVIKNESRGEKAVAILIHTVEANAYAHTVQAERKAERLLRKHISKQQWSDYFISGAFWELSSSGKLYIFRKGFPTIACDCEQLDGKYNITPKHTLCMHAGAYTEGTFAGGLCPTDDVIAHLLMMRTNEAHYLENCNVHQFEAPQSGV